MVRGGCFGERSDPDGLGDVVLAAFGHFGDDAHAGLQIRHHRLVIIPNQIGAVVQLH